MRHFALAVALLASSVWAENKYLGKLVSADIVTGVTNKTTATPFVITPQAKLTVYCTASAFLLSDADSIVADGGTNFGMGPILAQQFVSTSVGTQKSTISGAPTALLAMVSAGGSSTCYVWQRLGTESSQIYRFGPPGSTSSLVLTAALELSVNPDGGATSGCVSAANAAGDCRTVMAAINSIPKGLPYDVNVFVDGGTYSTESLMLSGFESWTLDAGTSTPTLTIKGRPPGTDGSGYTTATNPDAGPATGTFTAYTAGSGTTLTVATDSTQAWDVDGFVGWGVSTSLSGTTWAHIVSNTATTLTLDVTVGAVVPNVTTYTINRPSSVIQGTTGNTLLVRGNRAPIVLQDLTFLGSTANTWAQIINNSAAAGSTAVTCTRCAFVNTAAASPNVTVSGNTSGVTIQNSLIYSVRSGVLTLSGPPKATVLLLSSTVHAQQNATTAVTLSGGDYSFSSTVVRTQHASSPPITISTNTLALANVSMGSLKLICGASSTQPAIFANGQTGTQVSASLARFMPNTFSTLSCLGGIDAAGQIQWLPVNGGTSLIDSTGTSGTTYGYRLAQGAKFYLGNASHTFNFTSITNELTIEGAARPISSVANSSVTSLSTATGATGTTIAGPLAEGYGVVMPSLWESQFPDPADAGSRGMLLYGRDAGTMYFAEVESVGVNPAVTGRWAPLANAAVSRPVMTVPLGVTLAGAGAVLGYGIAPMDVNRLTVSAMSLRVTTAGTVGSTNASIRVSDGTSNCDCSFACNTANGSTIVPACSAGCTFDAGVALTITDNSKGDCTVGPILTVNSGQLWGTVN